MKKRPVRPESAILKPKQQKPKLKGFRLLTIDENNWWFFKVGYGSTVIRCKDRKLRYTVGNGELIGITESDFERGQHKKSSDGMVQPSHIRRYILENT